MYGGSVYPRIHAETAPRRPAFVVADTGEQLDWAELDERSAALAAWFRDRGLRPADTVFVLLGNDIRFAEVVWACWRSGLVVAPVHPGLGADELRPMLEDAAPAAVVAHRSDVVRAAGATCPVLLVGPDYAAALRTAAGAPETMGGRLLFSSGTTGRPKPFREEPPGLAPEDVPLRYAAMMTDLRVLPGPGESPPVLFSPGPAYHSAPMAFLQAVHQLGGTVVVTSRFDAEGSLAAMERHGVTHSLWVPTMFVRMLRLPAETRARYDHGAHRVAVHGAAPCPAEVKQAMMDWWGPILYEYYGSSEGYGRTSIGPEEWLAHPGSVGRPKGGGVCIADPAGRALPVGETGQVWLGRADARVPERLTAASAGWGSAGDLGRVDVDGYLYLTGRLGQTIITGGVNVYPREVEDLLALHPAVADVAVYGAADDEFGEQVRAVVAPLGDPPPGLAAELIDYCRARLAHHKCPRQVALVERVPRSDAGKILLGALRAQLDGQA
ncbi:fatty-acyl-CoA synthase [Pseudonocardia autotrophica]|uniref:Bile acid-coenzyme A ligase n=1 Tax=Pseudonocardia autotrophica TaxID=2074 RepID=A0A1Y2MQW2_PSEAH|nr:Bile acid-coenzyme A ligase [Pseudonocardia autotrophica]TDN72079.1 fatty-acyl-CoA synthase [Pseudonocardia autotrophica]